MFTKAKVIQVIACFLILFFVAGCANSPQPTPQVQKPTKDYKAILNDAKVIRIDEAFVSIGKQYNVYVGDEKVAEVKGDFFKSFGDTFVLRDQNGNFLIKETEIKRWLPADFERMAEVQDENNNTLGYIGEKVWSKLFSIGYTFHFFDKNKNMIGTSDQVNFTMFKENRFYDNNNKAAYYVEKKLGMTDTYIVTINDKSTIPLYQAILMVCIEDAIKDAKNKNK
jgi:uncharacterized protein YxjI